MHRKKLHLTKIKIEIYLFILLIFYCILKKYVGKCGIFFCSNIFRPCFQPRVFWPPGTLGDIWKHFCLSQPGAAVLPAWEPEMVGNTVHRTPPQQRITWSIMSILPRLRNSVLKELTWRILTKDGLAFTDFPNHDRQQKCSGAELRAGTGRELRRCYFNTGSNSLALMQLCLCQHLHQVCFHVHHFYNWVIKNKSLKSYYYPGSFFG